MVSESSSSDEDAQRNPKPDPNSIDQSLDAIENQLASISMSQSVSEPDSESESDHGVKDETKELRNGSFNEIEQLCFHSSFSGEVSGVGEEVVEVKVEGQDEEEEQEQEQEVDVPEASSSRVWRNASEVEDVEAPSSPSSSGYAGERGSTSSTSGIEEINDNGSEIHEVQNDGEFDAVSDSQTPWVPGKRHGDEVSPLFVIFIYYII